MEESKLTFSENTALFLSRLVRLTSCSSRAWYTRSPVGGTGSEEKHFKSEHNSNLAYGYPVDERAVWSEPAGSRDRKFRLLGRSEEGARIGPATIYVTDLIAIFDKFKDRVQLLNFQLLITHSQQKDQATIRVVPQQFPDNPEVLAEEILACLYQERGMMTTLLEGNIIHPLVLQWCSPGDMESNPRTGKTKHILDKRFSKELKG